MRPGPIDNRVTGTDDREIKIPGQRLWDLRKFGEAFGRGFAVGQIGSEILLLRSDASKVSSDRFTTFKPCKNKSLSSAPKPAARANMLPNISLRGTRKPSRSGLRRRSIILLYDATRSTKRSSKRAQTQIPFSKTGVLTDFGFFVISLLRGALGTKRRSVVLGDDGQHASRSDVSESSRAVLVRNRCRVLSVLTPATYAAGPLLVQPEILGRGSIS